MNASRQSRLIEGLASTLKAEGKEVTIRETHISWVLLAGEDAWKIKKEVDFGFLDFSTLEKRKFACEEELRLNRRFSPAIYLGVVSIGGPVDRPRIDAQSTPLEFAVHMRRFDDSGLLSTLASKQLLEPRHIDAVAFRVAQMHQQIQAAEHGSHWGEPQQVHSWLLESFDHIRALVDAAELEQVRRCEQLANGLYAALQGNFTARNDSGFVRECHGDLHLRNMVWEGEKVIPFDCIEFNPGLRWIDVMSEAAFVMMDLQERGYSQLAWRFINHYLAHTGDYEGLRILRYYACYRALVRAKVMLLQRAEEETPDTNRPELYAQYRAYAGLAEQWLRSRRPLLMITHGLSASGKSTASRRLAERYACIHIRSDTERKRLHGLEVLADSRSGTDSGIYVSSASDKTYQRLFELAASILDAGYPLIVDATFLQRKRRLHFQQLAADLNCPFLIIHCHAHEKELERRIVARARNQNDPSEATLEVLHAQIRQQQPLGEDETALRVEDSSAPVLPIEIADLLRE